MPTSGARWLPTPPHARGPIDAHPEGAILRQLHAECGGDASIVRPRSYWESARKGDLRVGGLDRPTPGSIADPFTVLSELSQQGLIRHLGVSNVSAEQLTEAQSIAPVVCVQNVYNVASRYDSELVSRCAREGIAYTPFFPLGGFTPLQSMVLDTVAARVGAFAAAGSACLAAAALAHDPAHPRHLVGGTPARQYRRRRHRTACRRGRGTRQDRRPLMCAVTFSPRIRMFRFRLARILIPNGIPPKVAQSLRFEIRGVAGTQAHEH